jgi:hypothetical protein
MHSRRREHLARKRNPGRHIFLLPIKLISENDFSHVLRKAHVGNIFLFFGYLCALLVGDFLPLTRDIFMVFHFKNRNSLRTLLLKRNEVAQCHLYCQRVGLFLKTAISKASKKKIPVTISKIQSKIYSLNFGYLKKWVFLLNCQRAKDI